VVNDPSPLRRAGSSWPVAPGVVARVRATAATDGDLAVHGEAATLAARRREVLDRPWVWLRQVHGGDVVVLDDGADLDTVNGASADAVVTARTDVVLAVHSADCATIALLGRTATTTEPAVGGPLAGGLVGAVHAGWRGLEAGVLAATVAAMRSRGAVSIDAVLGPCIGVECYEFGPAELERVAVAVGPAVVGRTRAGTPALDLRAGVVAALEELDVPVVAADPRCTACATVDGAPALHSHRARGDLGRQALLVWLDDTAGRASPT
jgi:copper oxidase (laccase) domain-containing protein